MAKKIYLSLGSNVGDRAKNLTMAISLLKDAGIQVVKVSSIYETEPVGYFEQEWFLNLVIEGETELGAAQLLRALRGIETRMGSKKPFANGPRLIDLDILLYADESINSPELIVPHPRMLQRKFVLAPLAEIAPKLQHPSWPATAKQMLATAADNATVRRFQS